MSICSDVVPDGIYIGKEIPMHCVRESNCKINGCFWRRFHELTAEPYRRKIKAAMEESRGR